MTETMQIITAKTELQNKDLSEKIIQAFYKVYNELGFGFVEKVYENALLMELRAMGLFCIKQKPVKVYYNTQIIGEFFADIVVNDSIILELKASENMEEEHEFQLVNYLKATEMEVGLLLNFGRSPEFKREVFTNERKKINAFKPS